MTDQGISFHFTNTDTTVSLSTLDRLHRQTVNRTSGPHLELEMCIRDREQVRSMGGPQWANCKVENKKTVSAGEKVRTPGMKYRHYSPRAKVFLFVPQENELAIEQRLETVSRIIKESTKDIKRFAVLSTLTFPQDLLVDSRGIYKSLGHTNIEIQANLFALLREVDEKDNVDIIFVEGIDEEGEGLAVMNRLRKAASDNVILF